MLELATPSSVDKSLGKAKEDDWVVTIPTHLRYLAGQQNGTAGGGQVGLDVPWPVVFWACEAEDGLKMATNPFDRVNLGYDGLFGPKTMFYHIPPAREASTTVARIQVPVLDAQQAGWVPVGTLVAVVIGFAWVCWQLFVGVTRNEKQGIKSGGKGKKDQ